jgi:predicted  nucleic acid-binding Zn-ribbon protein
LEHATTKDEKVSIMERFDGVKSIKESKALYDKIVNEMGSRKTISESVSKLDKSVASGKSNLSEHTAYVDNETARIRELMERVEGKKLL